MPRGGVTEESDLCRGRAGRLCPSCGATMKIVSFIEPTQPDVIDAILTHCGLANEPARAPPHAPPPGFRELQYVSDLEFVHDPGPDEPVWSAD